MQSCGGGVELDTRFVDMFRDITPLLEPSLDCLDDLVRCAGTRRQSDRVVGEEPTGIEISRILNMIHPITKVSGGVDQLSGVVAVGSPDDDDDITSVSQLLGGCLSLLGWLADGVAKHDV